MSREQIKRDRIEHAISVMQNVQAQGKVLYMGHWAAKSLNECGMSCCFGGWLALDRTANAQGLRLMQNKTVTDPLTGNSTESYVPYSVKNNDSANTYYGNAHVMLVQEGGEVNDNCECGEDAIAVHLGISYRQGAWLTLPHYYSEDSRSITPQHVIERLQRILDGTAPYENDPE